MVNEKGFKMAEIDIEQRVANLLAHEGLNEYERQLLTDVQNRFENLKRERECGKSRFSATMRAFDEVCEDFKTLHFKNKVNKRMLVILAFFFLISCLVNSYLICKL